MLLCVCDRFCVVSVYTWFSCLVLVFVKIIVGVFLYCLLSFVFVVLLHIWFVFVFLSLFFSALCFVFFFFKQKPAFEVRIGDWSSDVCSSDLLLEVERAEPDAIFLDLMMPQGPDGLTTLATLAERGVSAPVIMMSGQAQLADAVRATRLGAFQFIEKPLSPESVLVRSEGRRGGRECVSRGMYGWWRVH